MALVLSSSPELNKLAFWKLVQHIVTSGACGFALTQRTAREEVSSPAATAAWSSLVRCGESQVASH